MQLHILKSFYFTRTVWLITVTVNSFVSGVLLYEMTATIGKDALLPCEFELPNVITPNDIRVYWQLENTDVVYEYSPEAGENENQSEKYRHRTYLDKTKLVEGKCHLTLLNVTSMDSNVYKCIIQIRKSNGFEVIYDKWISLSLAANYSKPTITSKNETNRILLICSSEGGYPEAHIKWLSTSNHTLNGSKPLSIISHLTGTINITSTLEVTNICDTIYCIVSNPALNVNVTSDHFSCDSAGETTDTRKDNSSTENSNEFKRLHLSLTMIPAVLFLLLMSAFYFPRRRPLNTTPV
ncbi:ICOS ligand-like [Protopterus annectens]|uniref:ICOS ligand-like n=1 Tax=Protopterus annectens TaxID=7888 RepID=UPI001CFBB854|nr:ICOS ligand-like [Protopterus annectens]